VLRLAMVFSDYGDLACVVMISFVPTNLDRQYPGLAERDDAGRSRQPSHQLRKQILRLTRYACRRCPPQSMFISELGAHAAMLQ
jgi:hypothetical protein